ncbi:alpha/beta hydrolase [Thermodesulfobacteriota bacterium]
MAIFNRSKTRPDILKIIDRNNETQIEAAINFLGLEENIGHDLQEYMRKIEEANNEYFDILMSGTRSIKELDKILSFEEMVFVARLSRYISEYMADLNMKKYPIPEGIKIEKIEFDGFDGEMQILPDVPEDRILLYFHGGGQVLGSSKMHRLLTIEIGKAANLKVLSINYRLAPENPFPSGLEDCFSSYKWLLEKGFLPENIVIGGDSSGGNQTLATLLKIRDQGLPMPAGAFALSPAIDYTLESKTKYSNRETDMLSDRGVFWWDLAYLGNSDPYNPYISPVYGDLKGIPRLLLQVSTSEMLYDHSTRFVERARAAGVEAVLQEWDDMMHVWQGYGLHDLPEARESIDKIGEFVRNLFS